MLQIYDKNKYILSEIKLRTAYYEFNKETKCIIEELRVIGNDYNHINDLLYSASITINKERHIGLVTINPSTETLHIIHIISNISNAIFIKQEKKILCITSVDPLNIISLDLKNYRQSNKINNIPLETNLKNMKSCCNAVKISDMTYLTFVKKNTVYYVVKITIARSWTKSYIELSRTNILTGSDGEINSIVRHDDNLHIYFSLNQQRSKITILPLTLFLGRVKRYNIREYLNKAAEMRVLSSSMVRTKTKSPVLLPFGWSSYKNTDSHEGKDIQIVSGKSISICKKIDEMSVLSSSMVRTKTKSPVLLPLGWSSYKNTDSHKGKDIQIVFGKSISICKKIAESKGYTGFVYHKKKCYFRNVNPGNLYKYKKPLKGGTLFILLV